MMKVVDGGCLAHEFRVHADAEIFPGLLPGSFFQQWENGALHGPGQDGTAHNDYMEGFDPTQQLADMRDNAEDLPKAKAAVAVAGRADANERDIAQVVHILGGPQFAALHDRSD